MWPWGHLALGYVCYSLSRRGLVGGAVTGRDLLVLAVATQLPDLLDKTLSWGLGVFPSGYAVGHSAFVAVPLGVAALALGLRRDRLAEGLALAVGWWSHLVGDVLVAVALGGTYTVTRVLWPLVTLPGSHTSLGAVEQVVYYLGEFLELLGSPEGPLVFAVFFGPVVAAAVLWVIDGAPGLRELHQWAVAGERTSEAR